MDALLIELYATAIDSVDLSNEPHAFVTTNSEDFSQPHGDNRLPHPDLATLFGSEESNFGLGVDGLNGILLAHFGQEIEELFPETYFEEEPRRLDEITAAEHELFDRIWHHRSLQHECRLLDDGDGEEVERLRSIAGPGRKRVEETYTEPGQLGRYTDFE